MATDMADTYWNVVHDDEGCAMLYITVDEALPISLSEPRGRCAVALKLNQDIAATLRGALTGNGARSFTYNPRLEVHLVDRSR